MDMKKFFTAIFFSILLMSLLLISACSKKTAFLQTEEIRLVSLSPSITETVFALGAGSLLCGRTDFCNYPEEAKSVESVGGFDGKTLSVEKIIALKPKLVLGVSAMHDFMKAQLESYGIDLYLSRINSIEDVYAEVLYVGKVCECEDKAENLVEKMKEKIQAVKEYTQKNSTVKKVYWEVDSSPYISVGNKSYIHEMISIATGGQNIFYDLDTEFPVVSEETILARNPDVIIMPVYTIEEMTELDSSQNSRVEKFQRKNWQNLSAVKNNRVYNIFSDYISRTGPRLLYGIEIIAHYVSGYECTFDEE